MKEEKDALAEAIVETLRRIKTEIRDSDSYEPDWEFIKTLEEVGNKLDLGTTFDFKSINPDGC